MGTSQVPGEVRDGLEVRGAQAESGVDPTQQSAAFVVGGDELPVPLVEFVVEPGEGAAVGLGDELAGFPEGAVRAWGDDRGPADDGEGRETEDGGDERVRLLAPGGRPDEVVAVRFMRWVV